MKKNRISGLLFLLVILAVIGYSAHEMVNQGKDEDEAGCMKDIISVIQPALLYFYVCLI